MPNQPVIEENLGRDAGLEGGNVQSPFNTLRRFVKRRAAVERCDMCSAELAPRHQHLTDPASRQMICACQACAILFSNGADTKYRSVPRDARRLENFQLSEAEWDSLLIPIGMAFFFRSTAANKTVTLYPSPAGAIESLLDLDAWSAIVANNPVLLRMQPDTEALLVNRLKNPREYFLVPIDECYKLVGLIRTHWVGMSGGQVAWQEVEKFFAELRASAGEVAGAQHA